jgi:hypothetical protein
LQLSEKRLYSILKDNITEGATGTHRLTLGQKSQNFLYNSDALIHFSSVVDPGFLSRISDPTFCHPGSEVFPSWISIKEFKHFNPKKKVATL